MARNGSGTYSKVNTFVAGQSITASGHNQNWDDLATEMTNSVAADGQTPITGALKGSNGSAGTPSYGFNSDPDTGAYRIGTNNYGIAAGGTKIIDVATTGVSITGTLGFSGDFAINTNKFTVVAASGNTAIAGTLGVTGDVAVNTNKFNITAASGNTTIAGTLGVTGDVAINTNKLTVTAASGNTAIAGTLGVTSDFAINTNKFNVTASNGNTTIAGTLNVTGAITATAGINGVANLTTSAASSTAVAFTGIPSTAKQIIIGFNAVSLSGTASIIIQLGDSGGIETTGYVTSTANIAAGATSFSASTAGFIVVAANSAAAKLYGSVIISMQEASSNTWASHGNMHNDQSLVHTSAGIKATSAPLDRVTVTTSNGTDTFDNGTISMSYF